MLAGSTAGRGLLLEGVIPAALDRLLPLVLVFYMKIFDDYWCCSVPLATEHHTGPCSGTQDAAFAGRICCMFDSVVDS